MGQYFSQPHFGGRVPGCLRSRSQWGAAPPGFAVMARIVALCLSLISIVPLFGAELRTLAGKTLQGTLSEFTDKAVVLKTSAGNSTVPFAEVLQLELQKPAAAPTGVTFSDVELTDGTLVHCKKLTLRGKELEITPLGMEVTLRIPLSAVAYVLNGAHETTLSQEWQEKVRSRSRNQDQVAIRRDGVLNLLDGTLGDGSDKGEIEFTTEVGDKRQTRLLGVGLLQGLAFVRRPDPQAPTPLCKIVDQGQNAWIAARLQLADKVVKVTLVSGSTVELPTNALVMLDFTNDKLVYLSDLKPQELIERSKQGRKDGLHLDKNLDNGPLQMRGEVFRKGLAIHAHTELTYNLDGKFKKFDAVLGMDDTVGGDGQPKVRIEGDGRELFAGSVGRKDDPRPLKLGVQGVRQLRIIVSSSKLFDFGDHVDLADAKLSK